MKQTTAAKGGNAQVITVVNQKGGVGKTSTLFHLAGCYAEQGLRVLLIDGDPQHSLTTGIFGPVAADQYSPDHTITALFDDQCFESDSLVKATPIPGVDLVCGSDGLSPFNLPEPFKAGGLAFAIRDFVEDVRGEYDLILVDNPPNIQLCTWASLVAADFAVVVSQAEDYGSQGCVAIRQAIDDVRSAYNADLRLAGYVLNMFDRRLSIHKAYEELLRDLYGEQVFATRVPLLTHFKEAIAARTPVTRYKPKSLAADAIRGLANELLTRMELDDTKRTNTQKPLVAEPHSQRRQRSAS